MRTPSDLEAHPMGDRRPVDRELADLRKEVIEARNLVIKTDNLLKNLHAELKVVSKRHDDQYRRTWFSSAAAYGAFLVLAAAAAVFGARAAVSAERAQVESARLEADQAKKRAEEQAAAVAKLKAEQAQLRAESEKALAAYDTMSKGDHESRLKGVDALAGLDRTRLTALELRALDDRSGTLKKELAESSFQRGKAAYRRNEMKAAITDLKRFLALDPENPEALSATYFLGTAMFQTRDFEGCVSQLERFASGGRRMRNYDYALFLLGQCYEQLGSNDKAADTYRRALNERPNSEFAPQLQLRLRIASRKPAGEAAPAAAGSSPAGSASPTAGQQP